MDGPGVRAVDNETQNQASRTTKDGKKYTYKLNVIQQPSRARACGSGAKSSADRRPVDPPPIIELKIFEGQSNNEHELSDVTFSMNSTYFLFATLEQARHVANGRVPQQDQKTVPVLTGTPVAGMVYLDRPSPAGYFIFPDLSVRHEGKYRLLFSLYEQIKEAKDEDQGDEAAKQTNGAVDHVTQRCEVRSIPFTVYSAKKFPGLTESTTLSRVVAEQGCRVRIRRDVRMRRRDTKGGKDWDGYEDETAEARARVSATPEASTYSAFMDPIARPRTSSNASHHSLAPSVSRRPSLQDISPVYHQATYGSSSHTPHPPYSQSSPYVAGPSPSEHYSHAPFIQQQSAMQPPPPSHHQSYQPQPPLPSAASSQQNIFGYGHNTSASRMSHPQFAPPPSSTYDGMSQQHRMSVDYQHQTHSDLRRSSTQHIPAPPQYGYATAQSQRAYQSQSTQPAVQSTYPSYHAQQSHNSAADGYSNRSSFAEPVQPPPRTIDGHAPLFTRPQFHDKLPPLNTTVNMLSNKPVEPSSPASAAGTPQSSYFTSALESVDSNKRQYSQVFSERHLSQPLRHGARPNTPGVSATGLRGSYAASDDVDIEPESGTFDPEKRMEYRRADGRRIQRNLPPTQYD